MFSFSTKAKESKTFQAIQEERREQAERSVLISCPPKINEKKFLDYLSKHGTVNNHFFYNSYGAYAVVEFSSRDSIASLKESTNIPAVEHEAAVPFKSRLLSLKWPGSQSSNQPMPKFKNQSPPSIGEITQLLTEKDSIDEQLQSLTEALQLTEENGSGLSLEYQVKRGASERAVTQSILSVIGKCVDQFGPGCVGVQNILQARCPLVRFAHQPSGFQCDLTANNR
ncbi:poly(A) RNA mitochondrial [Labeo rohita]|nr:poly(A) RNA mitochondrial [Labeo rohita]